jgi:hypothetical protein
MQMMEGGNEAENNFVFLFSVNKLELDLKTSAYIML